LIHKGRYGEIARLYCNDRLYILEAIRHPYNDADAVWFDLYISNKSSKNRPYKTKEQQQYHLGGGDAAIIRRLVAAVREYLETWQPPYLLIGAYTGDDWVKRMTFYLTVLSRLGYDAITQYDREHNPGDVLMVPHQEGQTAFVRAGYDEEKDDFYFVDNRGKRTYTVW